MIENSIASDFFQNSFEGSHDEHCIFSEVFLGDDLSIRSNRCLVTGIINFESDCSKSFESTQCSNSESSAVTQSLCKNFYQNDIYMDYKDELSASGNFPDTSTSLGSVNVVGANYQKSSSDAILESEGKIGLCSQSKDSVHDTITLHLVESSGQGLTSSCYLLKKDVNLKKFARVDGRLRKSDTGGRKELVGAPSASPVSQESFAPKHVVPSPSFCALEKKESCHPVEDRISRLESPWQSESLTCLGEASKEDPRPLLQSHIFHLLQEIGWSIEKRKRPSRKHMDTIYRSPDGRLFREFPKAWRHCGQTLSANEKNFQQENVGMIWIGMSHFLSDLSDILMNIEKETDHLRFSNSWVQRWSLLDPFVTVVFIQKKIGALRRGNIIEASGSLVIEKKKKEETILASKVADCTKCLLSQKRIPSDCSGSSLAAKQLLPISETETSCQTHDDLKSKIAYDTGCFLSQDSFPSVHLAAKQLVPIPKMETSCQTHDVGLENNPCPPGITNKMLTASKFDSIPRDSDARSTSLSKLFGYVSDTYNQGLRDSLSEVQEEKSETFEHPNRSGLGNYEQQLLNDNESLSAHALIVPRQTEGTYERIEALSIKRASKKSSLHSILKRKARPKSKKTSECELMESDHTDTPLPGSGGKHGSEYTYTDNIYLNLEEIRDSVISKPSRELPMSSKSSLDQSKKRMLKKKRKGPPLDAFDRVQDTIKCQIQDDDLLVSAILRNKDPSSDASRSQSKCQKLRVQVKANSRKGGCKLRPLSMDKGSKHYSGFFYNFESRTVLAWLIVTDVISLNDIIQYRNSGDGAVIKEALVTWNGVICQCCSNLLSISEFKVHAGFSLNRPCLSLFLASGKSFSLCQLQAWSFEYKRRKSESRLAEPDEHDPNDDSCGLCGDGGELICCDNCPSTFHMKCLSMQELPEGNWYCSNCTCWICWNLTDDNDASSSLRAFHCSQCEHKYHEVCLKDKGACEVKVSHPWFCDESCEQVYLGINSQLGMINHISSGLSWTVLKCIHEDQKVPSAQRFALKAECNSKLAVALSILEECFQPMVDSRTGINMIPHVFYNWGSKFSRLNFGGFFTMVLEKNDVLISVASIRVHGTTVAEMPLIATCRKYRHQGMCRLLLSVIEEMLQSFKVRKLVIAAIPELAETWTKGFGFEQISGEEKKTLKNINLMVFPGTVLLKKSLYQVTTLDGQGGKVDPSTCTVEDLQSAGVSNVKSLELSGNKCAENLNSTLEIRSMGSEHGSISVGTMTNEGTGTAQVDKVATGIAGSAMLGIWADDHAIHSPALHSGNRCCSTEVGRGLGSGADRSCSPKASSALAEGSAALESETFQCNREAASNLRVGESMKQIESSDCSFGGEVDSRVVVVLGNDMAVGKGSKLATGSVFKDVLSRC